MLIAEEGDVKASIAALHFILSSAAKYSVDGESLANELQQLGLPKGKFIHLVTVILFGILGSYLFLHI